MTAETTGRLPAWLTPNLRILCGVSFLADTASELLYPILPIFLTTVLGAPAAVVGGVEGAAEATAALAKIVGGRIGDRRPKRPLIAVGYALAALGKIIVAAAAAWPVVLTGRCVDRLGKGVRNAPRDALLMVGADPGRKGRIFGVHRAADTAGAVAGPTLGLALYELLDHHIRPLLIIAVVPALAAVALVAAVRETSTPAPTLATGSTAQDTSAQRLPARLKAVIAVLTVFSLVNFPDSLLLLRAHQLGLSVAGVVGGYIAYNASYALLSYPAGAVSDRLPRQFVYASGLVCFAAGYLGLGLANSPGWVFVILPIYGGFTAATDGVGKAWIADLAPAARQSTAQGIYQGLTGVAVLGAGLWAGLAWHTDGRFPLLLSGSVAVVLAAILALCGRYLIARQPAAVSGPL
jgi:MFS family permease